MVNPDCIPPEFICKIISMNNSKNKPGRPKGKSKPARALSNAEVQRLFGVCYGKYGARNRAILALLFYSGARISTALKLTYGQLIDENGKCRSSYVVQKENEKSKRTHRYYLAKAGQQIINDYVKGFSLNRDDPLFASQFTGKPITPSSGCTLVKNLMLKAGIDDTSSHSGRKTFITNLYLNQSIGVMELMHIANHSSPQQTIKYINGLTPNIHKAMENLKY